MKYNLIIYTLTLLFGFFKFIKWITYHRRLPLDLLISITLIGMGVVMILDNMGRVREVLFIKYMTGGIILLLATFYSSTLLFWVVGLFIFITAIIDTIQHRDLGC
jgi:hypothetical protein